MNPKVDTEKGIIYGVRLISEGPAKGHGTFIDAKTVDQLYELTKGFTNGLKSIANHTDDVNEVIGTINNFQKKQDEKGLYICGDLTFFQTCEKRDYYLEMADKIPDDFGLSMSFKGEFETIEDKTYARAVELFSCDLVSFPAANPDGLFSEKKSENVEAKKNVLARLLTYVKELQAETLSTSQLSTIMNLIDGSIVRGGLEGKVGIKPKGKSNMSPEEMKSLVKECFAECMKPYAEKLGIPGAKDASSDTAGEPEDGNEPPADGPESRTVVHKHPDGSITKKHESHVPAPAGPDGDGKDGDDDEEEMSSAEKRVMLSVMGKLTKQGIKLSSSPAISNVPKPTPPMNPEKQTFEDLCFHHNVNGIDGIKSTPDKVIGYVSRNYPAKYKDYLDRCKLDAPQENDRIQYAMENKNLLLPGYQPKVEHWKVQGKLANPFEVKPNQ